MQFNVSPVGSILVRRYSHCHQNWFLLSRLLLYFCHRVFSSFLFSYFFRNDQDSLLERWSVSSICLWCIPESKFFQAPRMRRAPWFLACPFIHNQAAFLPLQNCWDISVSFLLQAVFLMNNFKKYHLVKESVIFTFFHHINHHSN